MYKHCSLLSFLLLFLCSPAQAQIGKAFVRTAPRLEAAVSQAALHAGVQQQVEKVVEKQLLSLAFQTQAYHLAALPNTIPASFQLPAFPLPGNEHTMYRGMALHAPTEELKHILKNGLEVSKCQAANFASYDGMNSSWAAAAIYASTDPNLALGYTATHLKEGNAHFPVLLHLKRVANSLFISVPHDIPPQWIEHVSTVLNVDGQPRWGELKWDELSKHFVFTPY